MNTDTLRAGMSKCITEIIGVTENENTEAWFMPIFMFRFFHDHFIILKRYALTFIITNTTVASKMSSFKCLERNKENKCKSLPKALKIMKNMFYAIMQ